MFLLDLPAIFQWWVALFLIGLIFTPLTINLFNSFFDKGYIFSKIIGLAFLGYLMFILGTFKILPFSQLSLIIILILGILVNLYIFIKHHSSIIHTLYPIPLIEEILFVTGLVFWAFVRGHEPSLHSLEKFMDFGFINSSLRSEYLPVKDIWMSGESINYYYFGHFSWATIIKLTGIDSAIGYNLILATLFGLVLVASFSLGSNLYRRLTTDYSLLTTSFAGILSSFLVTLGGNLHPIYAFFSSYNPELPVPFWTLTLSTRFIDYWYPNATRFIPFTIHEFPIYSFVVADLHGHLLNIPFVLLFIGLIILYFHNQIHSFIFITLSSLLIAIFLMTNVLDGPIYLLVLSVILFFKDRPNFFKNIAYCLTFMALFSLPFWISFKPFAQGVGVLCAPDFLTSLGKVGPLLFEPNHCQKSPLWMLMILWGFFGSVFLTFFATTLKIKNIVQFSRLPKTDLLVTLLSLSAFILILIPEFFYAKDIYPSHYRANTVFKFGYQAFIIMGIVSGYMLVRIFSTTTKSLRSILMVGVLFILFIPVLIYPYFAISSYYGSLKNYHSLDGIKYWGDMYPDDYQGILFLRKKVANQPIILEAPGDSYTDFERVSANTGLPTVIGWGVHEWLWRGSPQEGTKRAEDVRLIYEGPDKTQTQKLLKKYGVSLIFIGNLERQKYPLLNYQKLIGLGNVIFQQDNTTILQLPE